MGVKSQYIGVKGDECQCGRRATIRHCPVCGSPRIYARLNRLHTLITGEQRFVATQLRCQSCGHLFIEEERALCEAPPIGSVLAAQRVRALHDASQTGEYLNPVEAKAAKSIATALKQGESPEAVAKVASAPVVMSEAELARLKWDIRRAHADALLAHKQGKGAHPGDVEKFIEKGLKELYPNLQIASTTTSSVTTETEK